MNLEDLLCSNSLKDELFPDCYNTQSRDLAELFLCLDAIPGQQRIPTGSRVICNPPVMNTDEDWFVYVPEREDVDILLLESGFMPIEGGKDYSAFMSYRKGIWNVSVTDDPDLYQRSCVATILATRFNLLVKQDRVDLFNAIQFGALAARKELS